MQETIYTIPINEAFEKGIELKEQGICECPFCILEHRFESEELELILGASMMEPDVRIMTNEKGFCRDHFKKMLGMQKKLPLALMLESHLDQLFKEITVRSLLPAGSDDAKLKKIEKRRRSCYVCDRVEANIRRMFSNAVYMWDKDPDFAAKLRSQKYICLTHFSELMSAAQYLSKKRRAALYDDAFGVVSSYLGELCADVSHFCKKFDYRYEDEPWGNSKDSVERAIRFLKGSK